MQCKRDPSGKRIFSDEHAGIIENYIHNYYGKRECLPIDAICEIRDYMTQQLDEMSESMNKQNEEQKKKEHKLPDDQLLLQELQSMYGMETGRIMYRKKQEEQLKVFTVDD